MLRYILMIVFFVLISMPSMAAREKETREYQPVTFESLSQTYWWLSMLNIRDNFAVDEYARIHHCDLYETYYEDDFQWQLIREGIKEEIARRRPYFPHRYYIYAPIKLDRYDFEKSLFNLSDKSRLENVGVMPMFTDKQFKPYCDRQRSTPEYPDSVRIKFVHPINFTGIPLSQNKANELLRTMKENNNEERFLYLKLSFRISGFEETKSYATANFGTLKGTLEKIDIYTINEEGPGDLIYTEDVLPTKN